VKFIKFGAQKIPPSTAGGLKIDREKLDLKKPVTPEKTEDRFSDPQEKAQ
jgi:hypothetical protein